MTAELDTPAANPVTELNGQIGARVVSDLNHDLVAAARTTRRLRDADVTVSAVTVVISTGFAPGEVFDQAAAWAMRAYDMDVHALLWARVPDPGGEDELQLSMVVSAVDEKTGEYSGFTHVVTGRVPKLPHTEVFTGRAPAEALAQVSDRLARTYRDPVVHAALWAKDVIGHIGRRPVEKYRLTLVVTDRSSSESA